MSTKLKYINEAVECLKQAENCLKTSFIKLKFSPNYDVAAIKYERAAVCYKNAEDLEKSCEMYMQCASMHLNNSNLFQSARSYENAAMISKEMGKMDDAVNYMEKAADGYVESGSLDTSALALDKAAKFLESTDPEKAVLIYKKALTLVQQTDRTRMAGEFLDRLTKLYLKLEQFSSAIETIDSHIDTYIEVDEVGKVGNLTTAIVLVELARGDSVSAAKRMQKSFAYNSFESSEEGRVCANLISTYESDDNESFQKVLQSPVLKSMNNEFLRLMKTLKTGDPLGNKSNVEDEDFR